MQRKCSAGWSAGSLSVPVCLGTGGNTWTSECIILETGFALCVLSWQPVESQSYLSTTFLGQLLLRHLAGMTSFEWEDREWFLDQSSTTLVSSLTEHHHGAAPTAGQGFQFCTSENWQWYYQADTKSSHFKAPGEGAAFCVCPCPSRFNAAAVCMLHTVCLVAKQKEIYCLALECFYQLQLGDGKRGKGLLSHMAAWRSTSWGCQKSK